MIFALGFLVASLLALLMIPVLSRRALRLATRRLQMLVPLSMSEIVAERDQIRAEHAVATRRLEQKIAALEASKADLMGQAGRQATRIVTVENELAEARQPRRGLGGGARERHAGRAGSAGRTGAEMQLLHDTLGVAERRLSLLRGTEAELAEVRVEAERLQAVVTDLEARSTRQDLRVRKLIAKLGTERPAPKVTPDSETPADAGALRRAIAALADDLLRVAASRTPAEPARPVRNRPRRRPDRRPKPPSRRPCIKAARSSDRRAAGENLPCLETRFGHLLRPHPLVELLLGDEAQLQCRLLQARCPPGGPSCAIFAALS